VQHRTAKPAEAPNLYLTVSSPAPQALRVTQILEALAQTGASASLKRLDETPESIEAAFLLAPTEAGKLEQFNRRLRDLSAGVRISYLEDRGLGS
jgi:hypothetical protein